MRNPFRKKSSEEKFVDSFLKGVKKSMGDSQEVKDIYTLVKTRRDSGQYKEAQEIINNFVQAQNSVLRGEKDK